MDALHSPGLRLDDSGCIIHGACGKDAEEETWASQTQPTPRNSTTPSCWKVSLAAGSVDSGVLGQMKILTRLLTTRFSCMVKAS